MDNPFEIPVKDPLQDIQENLTPRHYWLFDTLAKQKSKSNVTNMLGDAAVGGVKPDDVIQQQRIAGLQQKAYELAAQTVDMPREEYNRLLAELKGAQGQIPQVPQMGRPQMPGVEQMGIAALGSLLFPEQSGKILASPFEAGIQEADRNYKNEMTVYESAVNARKEQLNLLLQQLEDQNRADLATYGRLDQPRQDQIKAVYSELESLRDDKRDKENQAKSLRAQFLQSSDPGEAQYIARMLDGTPNAIQPQELQSKIESLASADIKAFTSVVNSVWKSANTISEDDRLALENQAQSIAKRYGISRDALPSVPTSQTLAKRRADDAKTAREESLKLAREKFAFTKKSTAERLAVAWANVDVARQAFGLRQDQFAYNQFADSNNAAMNVLMEELDSINIAMRNSSFASQAALGIQKAKIMEAINELKRNQQEFQLPDRTFTPQSGYQPMPVDASGNVSIPPGFMGAAPMPSGSISGSGASKPPSKPAPKPQPVKVKGSILAGALAGIPKPKPASRQQLSKKYGLD